MKTKKEKQIWINNLITGGVDITILLVVLHGLSCRPAMAKNKGFQCFNAVLML
jgi:hypothetical protein